MTNIRATKRSLVFSVMALLLCFTMLLGTTFAWFTDSVTSSNNIIQSGSLDVEMYWLEGDEDPAATTGWADASKGAIFNNSLWEPGYTEAKHIKVVNAGTLALKYQMRILANGIVSELADVIDVYYFSTATALTSSNYTSGGTKLGTLSEVLNNKNTNAISNIVAGELNATESKVITLALHMQESAGNEYQNLSIGTDFSIQIIATQLAAEEDSFNNQYDSGAEYAPQETPSPMVSKLSGDELNISVVGLTNNTATLNAGYQFEPTETYAQAQQSPYRYYHADFVVTPNKNVPADSLALAGYYKLYCDAITNGAWVALSSPTAVAAGTEIRLIEEMGVSVNYEELCNFGNDGTGFQCGLIALDENVLEGLTVTVELRLYETEEPSASNGNSHNVETGNYITAGVFTYTFPKTVDTAAGLADALATGGTITLEAGEYKMPSNQSSTADLTIVGTKDTVVDVTLGAYMDMATVTFKGVTIKTGTGMANGNGSDYAALYTPNVTYIDCTFVGPMRVGRDGAKFINCTFNSLGNDYVWTYGNDVTFEGCTFNSDGKAILIYSDGGNEVANVTVKNCTFNSTQGAKAGAIANQNCAAIEIHNYGNGVKLVTEGNTYDSNFSGEWRIKTYETGKTQVFVNGVEYTTIAIDGHTMTIDANKNVTVQ